MNNPGVVIKAPEVSFTSSGCKTDGGKVNVQQQGVLWQADICKEAASVKIRLYASIQEAKSRRKQSEKRMRNNRYKEQAEGRWDLKGF